VQRDHICKIISRYIDAPAVPIENANVISTIARQEVVPDVGVSLNDRHIPMRSVVRVEPNARIYQASIKIAPLQREAIAEAIDE
jgi:hypothetical protein